MIFHPHGWIRNDQLVELIDYAVNKYGKRIKFLNFREAQERLTDLIRRALTVPKLRKATKPTRAARERRLEHKTRLQRTKRLRARPGWDD